MVTDKKGTHKRDKTLDLGLLKGRFPSAWVGVSGLGFRFRVLVLRMWGEAMGRTRSKRTPAFFTSVSSCAAVSWAMWGLGFGVQDLRSRTTGSN